MGEAIQLEFNIENKSSQDRQLSDMQKQINQISESMGKVRRKIFSEVSEVKKLCAELKKENEQLKSMLKESTNEKIEWTYGQGGCLFDVQDSKRSIC